MQNFDVVFVHCYPYFVNSIGEAMRLDLHPNFTTVEFTDFVYSKQMKDLPSYWIETFPINGVILFCYFKGMVSVF